MTLKIGNNSSELLMGRRLCSTIPAAQKQLVPKIPDPLKVIFRDLALKERQKENHDTHHGAYELPSLPPGDSVWVPDRQQLGEGLEEMAPRLYKVKIKDGTYR